MTSELRELLCVRSQIRQSQEHSVFTDLESLPRLLSWTGMPLDEYRRLVWKAP